MHFCAANTVEPTPCRLICAAKKRIYIYDFAGMTHEASFLQGMKAFAFKSYLRFFADYLL